MQNFIEWWNLNVRSRKSVRTFASVYPVSVNTGGYIHRYIEMSAGVCSQRAFDNTGEGGRTPRAEHASPCSDVTRDATLIFWSPRELFFPLFPVPIHRPVRCVNLSRARDIALHAGVSWYVIRSAVGIAKTNKIVWSSWKMSSTLINKDTNELNWYVMFHNIYYWNYWF